MSQVLDYLKANKTNIKDTLIRLTKAESPSLNKQLVDLCGKELKREFTQLIGGDITIIEKETVGNQYKFTYGNHENSEQILIIGHLDTVWDEGVLPLKEEGDFLYGPGVFDMKGGLTISLWAIKAVKELNVKGNCNIVLLVTTDEEIGSNESKGLILEEAQKSKVVFIPESSIEPNGAVKTARKGVGKFTMKVEGIAAHAGINAWDGASAIEELAHQIIDLKKLSNQEEGISINIGVIHGGTRSNVIAKEAYAEIDVRITKKEQAEKLQHAILNRPHYITGTKVEVAGSMERFPLERTEQVIQLYEELREIARVHGYELEEGASGGASDGNLTAGIGIPTIDGLGPLGGGAHQESEHVSISNLPYRAALLAEMLIKHSCVKE
ncbi:M20 family metallopeptidase [Bacillus pinisoli]|uniref:M20 family metallopeptidase n=1 Tax=Bacillus pinisoli TaxID=2901866 RepID=UPI001FF350E6|nr:M20 family metallopeptidase [Bacillus pinisoli]